MAIKTTELIKQLEQFLAGGNAPGNINEVLIQLRLRKKYDLLRKVIQKLLDTGAEDQDLIYMKAFSYFKDYTLSDFQRWDEAEKCLEPLINKRIPRVEALLAAIEKARYKDKGRKLLDQEENNYPELKEFAKQLEKLNAYNLARRLFLLARGKLDKTHEEYDQITQKLAYCTYRDGSLPINKRLDEALHILNNCDAPTLDDSCQLPLGELVSSKDPNVVNLAGAIYMRKWQEESRKADLEQSLEFYLRSYTEDMERVNATEIINLAAKSSQGMLTGKIRVRQGHLFGYPGINAALTLDMLGELENSRSRKKYAQDIRKTVTQYLSALLRFPDQSIAKEMNYDIYWVKMTLVTGYFGLKQYKRAGDVLKTVKESSELWKIEASVRQLIQLTNMHGVDINSDTKEGQEVRQILERFLGSNLAPLDNIVRGKVGLALSGGGFRASLYHIGVLAKLAEFDLLRHVEVISSVSGGSIIAAHYYLEVRKLLQSRADGTIKYEEYIDIVKRVARHFTKGVQKNLRMRVIGNFFTNLRMILFPTYSRTVRAGELYEKLLYSQVDDGEDDEARWLNSLYIEPDGANLTFKPAKDNWLRKDKVPIMVINATSLNTGNNWQFTASWMGEPPPRSDLELEGKTRLRPVYYRDAPARQNKVRLGVAVGASACVPGLFEPVVLNDLYREYTVRLVDGGVFENQGISGLLSQDCDVLLVSDASGQISAEKHPGAGVIGPLLRSTGITMSSVRRAELHGLQVKLQAGLLSKVMSVHLKKDLGIDTVDYIDCRDHSGIKNRNVTRYSALRSMQAALAATRTDLDSFSDAEAWALMTSGYLMTEHAAKTDLKGVVDDKYMQRNKDVHWEFLEVEEGLKDLNAPNHDYLKKILEVSHSGTFRSFQLQPLKALLATLLIIGFYGAGGYGLFQLITRFSLGVPIMLGAGGILCLLLLFKMGYNIVKSRSISLGLILDAVLSVASGAFFAVMGWLMVITHRLVFDRMFLKHGSKEKLKK